MGSRHYSTAPKDLRRLLADDISLILDIHELGPLSIVVLMGAAHTMQQLTTPIHAMLPNIYTVLLMMITHPVVREGEAEQSLFASENRL